MRPGYWQIWPTEKLCKGNFNWYLIIDLSRGLLLQTKLLCSKAHWPIHLSNNHCGMYVKGEVRVDQGGSDGPLIVEDNLHLRLG